jgi:N-acetylmuramoyl-L-alanine amidase
MKIGIDIGHNCPPYDVGAVGIRQEDELTKAVGELLMQKLAADGNDVINCTPNMASSVIDSLMRRVDKANYNQVSIYVSIHFNAVSPTNFPRGTEVYAVSNVGKSMAQSILSEITKLGFKDRGVKNAPFYVIKKTTMPAVLVECCFIDSKADMDILDVDKLAEAIKVGLVGPNQESGTIHSGKLKVLQPTILKPSTDQSSSLSLQQLVNIMPGEYSVLDFRHEERHYWVKMSGNQGGRSEHFVFDGHADCEET